MKLKLTAALLVASVVAACAAGGGNPPTAEEIEPKLREFLTRKCQGEATVAELTNIRVGDYNNQFSSWSIHADYQTSCREGNVTTTLNGSNSGAATAFARRTSSGEVEVFIPAIFENALN